jgi:SAM-dependent methyltransferase
MNDILQQAIDHIPALLFIWIAILATYWLSGIINFPGSKRRDAFLDKFASVDIQSLGGFSWKSLAVISLTSLFLELLLIRWIASEVRIFAYFKSLVLVACFLGFGLGCYLTRKRINIAYTFLPLVLFVLLIELPLDSVRRLVANLSNFIGWFSDVHIWSQAYFAGNPAWGVVSSLIALSIVIPLFGLIALTMVPFGQLVGWLLENSKKGVQAYSVNVVTSLCGIWLFTLLSFMSTPPWVWFAVLSVCVVGYFWKLPKIRWMAAASFGIIFLLFFAGTFKRQWWGEESWKGSTSAEFQLEAGEPETLWSPYQKLTFVPLKKDGEVVRYVLNTNDSWYQQIINLSEAELKKNPELYDVPNVPYHQYNLPYRFYPAPKDVLIAGSGMGNDPAAALRNGAQHVVTVEIDPLIYEQGKKLNFERPYSSDKVEMHVDDARNFVQNSDQKFDLIVFSILDSHTTSSSYTNIRLDNYVYTQEAMQATRKLLKPDGMFVMSFSGARPWFAEKLREVVAAGFGKEPIMMQPNYTFFIVDFGNRFENALAENPELAAFVASHSNVPLEAAAVVTDDWPYLYQQYRGIPIIVWVLSLGLIGVCWLTFRKLKGTASGLQWHFFFLGAAFMLLEVQIISKTALLFGTTWLVNSIIITSLLFFILLSNLVVTWFPNFPKWLAYMGLFFMLALGYLLPSELMFHESLFIRGIIATALYCSPVFFAGLVFIRSFKQVGFRAEAFGSNLLGSLVGGLLDSLSFIIGIKALVLVAALLYLLSWVTSKSIASDSVAEVDGLGFMPGQTSEAS